MITLKYIFAKHSRPTQSAQRCSSLLLGLHKVSKTRIKLGVTGVPKGGLEGFKLPPIGSSDLHNFVDYVFAKYTAQALLPLSAPILIKSYFLRGKR